MADEFKCHIDHPPALAPPAELTEARAALRNGSLDKSDVLAVEDAAITAILRVQRRIEMSGVSDASSAGGTTSRSCATG